MLKWPAANQSVKDTQKHPWISAEVDQVVWSFIWSFIHFCKSVYQTAENTRNWQITESLTKKKKKTTTTTTKKHICSRVSVVAILWSKCKNSYMILSGLWVKKCFSLMIDTKFSIWKCFTKNMCYWHFSLSFYNIIKWVPLGTRISPCWYGCVMMIAIISGRELWGLNRFFFFERMNIKPWDEHLATNRKTARTR